MIYEQKNYENLIGASGLSETLLKNHFTLYGGYVTNTNKLTDEINNLIREGKTAAPQFAELKRRFGWEFNGMRLHEYYFENMSKEAKAMNQSSKFLRKIVEDFGSYENWEKDFKAIGAMRGIGWVILCLDIRDNTLFNIWVNEHHVGHLCGSIPLLVMDVFEHAYIIGYGLRKADYIESFFKLIDWEEVNNRLIMGSK